MPTCVVKSCKNYGRKIKKSQGITYHAFPKDKDRRDDWIAIIRNSRGEKNWKPSSYSTMCSAHFYDEDFVTTAKGLRRLVPYAIPKRLLSNSAETQSPSSPIPQMSPKVKEEEREIPNDQQPTSPLGTISTLPQVFEIKEELNLTEYCRLCTTITCDGSLINVESDNDMKEIVVKMLGRLNINIDFSQEHLPTTICSICIKSLYTSYDFVVGIDMAQMTPNDCEHSYKMRVNFDQNIKAIFSHTSLLQTNSALEACDTDQPVLQLSTETTSSQQLSPIDEAPRPISLVVIKPNTPSSRPPPRERLLKHTLDKKILVIDMQKKNLKRLNQKIRRLKKRNVSLKNIVKKLKDQNVIKSIQTE